MKARTNVPELDRIRRDIGTRLRIEHGVAERPPQSLMVLLKELEIRVRDGERERLFAEVDVRIAELIRATTSGPQTQELSAKSVPASAAVPTAATDQ
jgi:hypothetical protein